MKIGLSTAALFLVLSAQQAWSFPCIIAAQFTGTVASTQVSSSCEITMSGFSHMQYADSSFCSSLPAEATLRPGSVIHIEKKYCSNVKAGGTISLYAELTNGIWLGR